MTSQLARTTADVTATDTDTVNQNVNNIVMAMSPLIPNIDHGNDHANGNGNGTSAKSKSPHFMSPTISSSKQVVAKSVKEQAKISPPSALTSSHTKPTQWIASAVRRVGFTRGSDSAPRFRKESTSANAVTFPDKVCTFFLLEFQK